MYKIAQKHKTGRKQKENIIKQLKEELSVAKGFILANYEGSTVAQLTELRRSLAKYKSKMKVVKNRLFERAIKELGLDEVLQFIHRGIAVIFCYDEEEIVNIVKHLMDYIKQNEKFRLLGGYLYEEIVGYDKIKEIALLPSKQELIAKSVYLLSSPIRKLVSSLKYPINSLVNILMSKSIKSS